MERYVKNGKIILDGTLPECEKEKLAFEQLEAVYDFLEKYGIKTIEELESFIKGGKNGI